MCFLPLAPLGDRLAFGALFSMAPDELDSSEPKVRS